MATQKKDTSTKKHSGCKSTKYTPKQGVNKGKEQRITNGWMYRKQGGLTVFKAVTTSASQDAGKGWVGSVAVEVINRSTGQKSFYWGCMEWSTGKVVIGDLGIVMNPKGGKGGYTGSFTNN